MRRRFLILCLGRTGSSHLVSLLDSHPEIRCYSEPFAEGPQGAGEPLFRGAEEADPIRFLERIEAEAGTSVVGLKLPMNSIRAHPGSVAILDADPSPLIVSLRRRNSLGLLVSRRLVAATGVSQSIYGNYGAATIELPADTAIAALEAIEAEQAELDGLAAGRQSFELSYEELAAGERLDGLQRFLGVEPAPLRSWFTRLRTRPLHEAVSNWEELAAALAQTRFAALLREAD